MKALVKQKCEGKIIVNFSETVLSFQRNYNFSGMKIYIEQQVALDMD